MPSPFSRHTLGEMRAASAELDSASTGAVENRARRVRGGDSARIFSAIIPEARAWRMAEPPGDHPAITAWLTQRITRLWNEKRARESVRLASPRQNPAAQRKSWTVGAGVIASVTDCGRMSGVLEQILPAGKPERVLVKVTWHGYATGTYTDPAALDLLLRALPAPRDHSRRPHLFKESGEARHSIGRRKRARIAPGSASRRPNICAAPAWRRCWPNIAPQYVNVTEAYWDEGCDANPRQYVPRSAAPLRGLPDDQLREIQRAHAPCDFQSVRPHPPSFAIGLARAEHHLLCSRLLQHRESLRRAVSAERHRTKRSIRPCDGIARACTAAAGAITI